MIHPLVPTGFSWWGYPQSQPGKSKAPPACSVKASSELYEKQSAGPSPLLALAIRKQQKLAPVRAVLGFPPCCGHTDVTQGPQQRGDNTSSRDAGPNLLLRRCFELKHQL